MTHIHTHLEYREVFLTLLDLIPGHIMHLSENIGKNKFTKFQKLHQNRPKYDLVLFL